MKTLLTIAVLGLSLSGFAFASESDRANVPEFKPTMGQPIQSEILGRAGYPEPVPTTSNLAGLADVDLDSREYNGHS